MNSDLISVVPNRTTTGQMKRHARTLNVAGPRASKQPGIYDYVRQLVLKLLGDGIV